MEISKKLDWLTYSHHDIEHWYGKIPLQRGDEIGEQIKPLPRYAIAYSLLPAGRVDIADNVSQGVVVNITGKELTEWIANGVSYQSIVNQVNTFGKVTRLDFAIDIQESRYGVNCLWRDIQTMVVNKKVKTRMRPQNEIDNKSKGGYSQYFGSYKSDQFIRVYDKAAESGMLLQAMKQHIVSPHWTRIEIVTKNEFAELLTQDMVTMGWQAAGSRKISNSINFPLIERWADIIGYDVTEISTTHRKPSKWQKWMDTQVLSSINQHVGNSDDRAFLLQWLRIVTDIAWNAEHGSSTSD